MDSQRDRQSATVNAAVREKGCMIKSLIKQNKENLHWYDIHNNYTVTV